MSDHYFCTDPAVSPSYAQVSTRVWGHDLHLVTATGVFAHGRVDKGTAVLTGAAEPRVDVTSVLDLGCGWGLLATAVALHRPAARVWAVDVNERARILAAANAERAGVADRVQVAAPDEVPGHQRFDELWSNPPIRIGKPAVRALLSRWLPRLDPDGRALLVIGKNLGADSYHRWLGEAGYATQRIASSKGFRVLEVRPTNQAGESTDARE